MEYPAIGAKSLVLSYLLLGVCTAEKLSLDQKAPLFARGSGGLSLPLPLEGDAISGIPRQVGGVNPAIGNSISSETPDGVQREEVATFKQVGDSVVRVVEGRYAYTSPEGLPISVKYTADENGTRASFSFGTDAGRKSQFSGQPASTSRDRPGGSNERPSGYSAYDGKAYLPP